MNWFTGVILEVRRLQGQLLLWLTDSCARVNGQQQRDALDILLYFWWNVWKEGDRCIFDNVQGNEFHLNKRRDRPFSACRQAEPLINSGDGKAAPEAWSPFCSFSLVCFLSVSLR
jgi:hypothetical protein